MLFAERYGTCGTSGNVDGATTNGNLWADSNCRWRPVFLRERRRTNAISAGYTKCLMFQVSPDWLTQCEPRRAQSPHSGIIHAGMGDGSVQFFGGNMDSVVWERLCDPRDGEIVTIE